MTAFSSFGSQPAGMRDVHAGFIPLVDCAPIIIARELGFDREQGVALNLHREVSWANIRDKLDAGVFECAHMLAPVPLAATLGLGRATEPIIAPMALSLNGNAITVSLPLYDEMQRADQAATNAGGMAAAVAFAKVVRQRQAEGREPLTLGMVYPFSSHNYDLRYWIASAGIDPDAEVNLIVVPPPLISQSLSTGRVDGFCVGEPWNSLAVAEGTGAIVATKRDLWSRSPEKVLGVREKWAQENSAVLGGVIRALALAGQWLGRHENLPAAAQILARPMYVGVSAEIIMRSLTGHLMLRKGVTHDVPADVPEVVPEMVLFHDGDASFPWRSHAVWFLTQMIRWGHVREPFDMTGVAERVYRPDIYREAVAVMGLACPLDDYKSEGGLGFFGGAEFDPAKPMEYVAQLALRAR